MKKIIFIIISTLSTPILLSAQNAIHSNVAQGNNSGYVTVLPFALVTIAPSSLVYTSISSTTSAVQPIIADANGNYNFFTAPCTTFNITINATGFPGYNYNWTSPAVGGGTCKQLNNVLYIDPTNQEGWSGSELGSWVISAYNLLPGCTDSGINGGPNTYPHCGKIVLTPGTYTWSSQQTITSPYVSIEGASPRETAINYTGVSTTSCALNITSSPFATNDLTGVYSGFALIGNTSSNICGIKYYDVEGFHLENVIIGGFTGSSSSGLIQQNVSAHTERAELIKVWLTNNTISWNIQSTVGATNYTYGYGNFDVYCVANAGQTCVQATGLSGTAHSLVFNNSNFHFIGNIQGGGTCFNLSNNTDFDLLYNLECEQTSGSGGVFRTIDSTSTWQGIGLISNYNLIDNANANGHRDTSSYWSHTGGIITIGSQTNFINPFPATSGVPQNPPALLFQGQYWNGSSSALDQWQIAHVINSGTNGNSTIQFIHTGSSGSASVQVPKFTIPASSGGGDASLIFGSATDFPTVTLPDATGTLSQAQVENCGATTGGTQPCAKTTVLSPTPIIIYGDVQLNTANTQSITTLPFSSASTYSCTGSDLTTAAGIVSFNTYAAASVTIQESGGTTSDHLRYSCVGF